MASSSEEQHKVLLEALRVYDKRHEQRGDLWKHYGWRGALHECRVAVERAWVKWFKAPTKPRDKDPDVDELLDTINYAAMTIRAIREDNRDGTSGWWSGV